MKDDKKELIEEQKPVEEKKPESDLILKPGMKYGDHILNTRRDFLSQGLITGTAWALMPSALDMMVSNALAADSSCVFRDDFPLQAPFIMLDLSGGCNMMGSGVAVGGVGGQDDRSVGAIEIDYRSLGLPPALKPTDANMDRTIGRAFHNQSPMLEGLKATAGAAVLNKMDGMIFPNISDNDTGNNPSNPAYFLNKAGAVGKLAALGGTRNSVSGGNSAPAGGVNPAAAPVQLESSNDARGLTSLGKLGNGFATATKDAKIDRILRATASLSDKKLESINRRNLPEALQKIVSCNIAVTPDQIKAFTPDALDPSRDANVRAAFPEAYNNTPNAQGVFTGQNTTSPLDGSSSNDQRRVSTLAYLALKGYVGVGTIEIGGYDYHLGGTRTEANAKDKRAGAMLGRIMTLARLMGKDCFVGMITDGAVAAATDQVEDAQGRYNWGGDNGERSCSLMFLYQHSDGAGAKRPAMYDGQGDKLRQIGAIKRDGSVDAAYRLTSNSMVNTAKAMVLNYLSYHGKTSDTDVLNALGDNPMANNQAAYIGFKPKA